MGMTRLVEFGTAEPGVFMRTSWILAAKTAFTYPFKIRVKHFSVADAEALITRIRKRNVFARHSWENNFYLEKIRALANKTIIEVYRPGQPDDFADEARKAAALFENLAILSCTVLSKRQLLRDLGIASRPAEEVEFVAGSGDYFLRAKTKLAVKPKGLPVTDRFDRRFRRYGFVDLFDFCISKHGLAERVTASIHWLTESRLETRLEASIVKTAIALETLLIFSETESLARSLSERAAFILSPVPDRRHCISKIIRRFYEARSGVVHGSRDKARLVSSELLEIVDRLITMLNLTVSANAKAWTSQEALRDWCEAERWGAPSTSIVTPYPDSFLRKALERFSTHKRAPKN